MPAPDTPPAGLENVPVYRIPVERLPAAAIEQAPIAEIVINRVDSTSASEWLYGTAGVDYFVYDVSTYQGDDVIFDFNPEQDKIVFVNVDDITTEEFGAVVSPEETMLFFGFLDSAPYYSTAILVDAGQYEVYENESALAQATSGNYYLNPSDSTWAVYGGTLVI